jgi:hypothetical protein
MLVRCGVFVLAFAVLTALLFGGVAHALVPHDHHTEASLAIHAALHLEKLSDAIFVVVAIFAISARVRTRIPVLAYSITPIQRYVYRGIAPHRRFG